MNCSTVQLHSSSLLETLSEKLDTHYDHLQSLYYNSSVSSFKRSLFKQELKSFVYLCLELFGLFPCSPQQQDQILIYQREYLQYLDEELLECESSCSGGDGSGSDSTVVWNLLNMWYQHGQSCMQARYYDNAIRAISRSLQLIEPLLFNNSGSYSTNTSSRHQQSLESVSQLRREMLLTKSHAYALNNNQCR